MVFSRYEIPERKGLAASQKTTTTMLARQKDHYMVTRVRKVVELSQEGKYNKRQGSNYSCKYLQIHFAQSASKNFIKSELQSEC